MITKQKNKKVLIGIIAAAVLVVGIVCGSITIAGNTPEKRADKYLDLGDKYLSELDYERALVAYQQVLEIEPKNLDAYKGALLAYEGLGDKDGMESLYADALDVIEGLKERERKKVYDTVVEIYLYADAVYPDNHEAAARVLERGFDTLSGDEQIIRALIKEYGILAGNYIDAGDYEKEQEIYKKILEKKLENADALSDWEQRIKERFQEYLSKNGGSGNVPEATPEPTAESTSIPTAEPVRYVEEMFTVSGSEYESYGYAYGGSIPVKKDGKWGAVNYENKVIVPFEYDGYRRAPDDHGRFVLYNSVLNEYVDASGTPQQYETRGETFLFDNQGKIIYRGADDVMASGGMYIVYNVYEERQGDIFYDVVMIEFHRMDGSVAASVEGDFQDYQYGFYDGKCCVIDHSRRGDIGTMDLQGNITWSKNPYALESAADFNLVSAILMPISTINHGYQVFGHPVAPTMGVTVYDEDGNRIAELAYMYLRADENGDITMGEDWVDQGFYGYWVDGSNLYNYGSKMVFEVGGKRVLIDFARSSGGTARQPDLDNIVLAVYDYIEMADEKYWLVQFGEKWGYIDHEGREIAMFEDAGAFRNGYALVKENGEAWLIDESLQKLQNLGAADGVFAMGEIYGVRSGDKEYFYRLIN